MLLCSVATFPVVWKMNALVLLNTKSSQGSRPTIGSSRHPLEEEHHQMNGCSNSKRSKIVVFNGLHSSNPLGEMGS